MLKTFCFVAPLQGRIEVGGSQVRKSDMKPHRVSGWGEIVKYIFLAKYPYL